MFRGADRKGQRNKSEWGSLKRSLVRILNYRGQLHQHKITALFDFSTDGGTLKLGRHVIMWLFAIRKVQSWYIMTKRDNNGAFLRRNVKRWLSICFGAVWNKAEFWSGVVNIELLHRAYSCPEVYFYICVRANYSIPRSREALFINLKIRSNITCVPIIPTNFLKWEQSQNRRRYIDQTLSQTSAIHSIIL